MDTPPPSFKRLSCPGAPMKKRGFRPKAVSSLRDILNNAQARGIRDLLLELPCSRKQHVLRHVAPVAAEVIFHCYCDWKNNKPDEQFSPMLMAVPDLDLQVEEHAKAAMPGMTHSSWHKHMQRACCNYLYKVALAEQFRTTIISGSPACRVLCFDDCTI